MKNVTLAYKADIFLSKISEVHWSKPLESFVDLPQLSVSFNVQDGRRK